MKFVMRCGAGDGTWKGAALDLVNRSAIWYLRELEEVSNRQELTAAGALCLLYQDRLLREKTRETIRASTGMWEKNTGQHGLRPQLAASGRWMDWLRVTLLMLALRACIVWLKFGPPIWEHRALRKLIQVSEYISHFGLDQVKP
jgi:hypothetical protein